jgi:hypothetical protein
MDPRAKIKYDQCGVKGNNKRSEGISINLRHSRHNILTNFIQIWYGMCILKAVWHSSFYSISAISRFRRGASEVFAFLKVYTAQIGSLLPTFRDNLSVSRMFELLNTEKKTMSKSAAGPDALSCTPLPAPLLVTKHRNTPAQRRPIFRKTTPLSSVRQSYTPTPETANSPKPLGPPAILHIPENTTAVRTSNPTTWSIISAGLPSAIRHYERVIGRGSLRFKNVITKLGSISNRIMIKSSYRKGISLKPILISSSYVEGLLS